TAYYFLIRQVIWACLGLVCMVAAMRTDYRKLRHPAVVYSAVVGTLVLLIAVLFLPAVNETHRWIRLGQLSLQPAEMAKLATILFLAYHLERRDRIEAYLNPWSDARGSGYQIIQSLIAVGTGGLTGVGLMEGHQKLFYLPYPYSDFIYAVIGEELGLLGAGAELLAFVLLLWR